MKLMNVTATLDSYVHSYIADAGVTLCGQRPQGGTQRQVDCDECILHMNEIEHGSRGVMDALEKLK